MLDQSDSLVDASGDKAISAPTQDNNLPYHTVNPSLKEQSKTHRVKPVHSSQAMTMQQNVSQTTS